MPTDPSTVVIYNPAAGRGRARKQIEDARVRLGSSATLIPTERAGQATALTRKSIDDGATHVIAAGGDGTVHEVASGILDHGHAGVKLGIWPLGSMNDLAYSLGLLDWWTKPTSPLDAMVIDVGRAKTKQQTKWFVDAAGIGFNGMVTIESRKTKWLKGIPLYAWGLIKAMVRHYRKPVMKITIDGQNWHEATLAFSLCNGQREGGFPLGLNALLDDGQFDVVHVGDVHRWELMRYLPNMITGRLPTNHPHLQMTKATHARVECETPLCCHLDGEFLCRPEDGITEIDIEIQPKKLLVDCFRPGLYGGRKAI